jgi:hypothetical protein
VEHRSIAAAGGSDFRREDHGLRHEQRGCNKFCCPVVLTGAVGGGVGSFPILGNIGYQDFSFNQHGPVSAGYSFTSDADLLVTHARHYSGGRVSIWTDDGVLLTARDVSDFGGFPGSWLETPLLMPLVLYAGNTYRVTLWSGSNRYYWRNSSVTSFPNGLIGPSYVASTDVFPRDVYPSRTWLVDLRYTVGVSNSVAIAPTVTGNFVDGVWTGSMSVLQGAKNMSLSADDGAGHSGKSNPFTVSVANDVVISSAASLSRVPLGDPTDQCWSCCPAILGDARRSGRRLR